MEGGWGSQKRNKQNEVYRKGEAPGAPGCTFTPDSKRNLSASKREKEIKFM